MYRQDIIISPDIFEIISRAFSYDYDVDIDLKSYIENLKLKNLMLDLAGEDNESVILKEIVKIAECSSDIGKKKIKIILDLFLKSERIKYVKPETARYYHRNETMNAVLNISQLSNSKIINTETPQYRNIIQLNDELKDIELLDFVECITPPNSSRLYCLQKKLRFNRGEQIPYKEYFLPYLYDSKNIKVYDRYIRRDTSLENLIQVLKLSKNIVALSINTIVRENNSKDNFDLSVSEMKERLLSVFPEVQITVQKTDAHERRLITDEYDITIDPGFNFVNKHSIAEYSSVTIDISRRKPQRDYCCDDK